MICELYVMDLCRVQEDSQEYLNRLSNRFGEMLKSTPFKDTFLEVVGGSLQTQTIGRGECKHIKTREEVFTNIMVEIKQKKTLLESLKAFVAGETMSGDNAIKCECCNKKVDATRRTVISKLPSTLIIALKRFELNYQTFQPVKVNDRLDFPMDLDMKPYTVEALTSEDQLRKIKETKVMIDRLATSTDSKAGSGPVNEIKEDDKEIAEVISNLSDLSLQPAQPDEYYRYMLRGVVIHSGGAHGGHYYSYIQERTADGSEGNWFEFNDTHVSPFDIATLDVAAFGNPKTGAGTNGYLLFYERKSTTSYDSKAVTNFGGAVYQEIFDQLVKATRDRIVFEDNYFSWKSSNPDGFLWKLLTQSDLGESADVVARLAVRFFFVTFIRATKSQNTSLLERWATLTQKLISNSAACAAWFLSNLDSSTAGAPSILMDGLGCVFVDVRKWTAQFIWTAFVQVASQESARTALNSLLERYQYFRLFREDRLLPYCNLLEKVAETFAEHRSAMEQKVPDFFSIMLPQVQAARLAKAREEADARERKAQEEHQYQLDEQLILEQKFHVGMQCELFDFGSRDRIHELEIDNRLGQLPNDAFIVDEKFVRGKYVAAEVLKVSVGDVLRNGQVVKEGCIGVGYKVQGWSKYDENISKHSSRLKPNGFSSRIPMIPPPMIPNLNVPRSNNYGSYASPMYSALDYQNYYDNSFADDEDMD
jgi:hypothetical protein